LNQRIAVLLGVIMVSGGAGIALQQSLQTQRSDLHVRNQSDVTASIPAADTDIIGQRRPDFTLPDVSGSMRNMAEWDGQVVAVNFWATWCPPCLKEVPELVDLQHRYSTRGFQVIGIAIQKPEELTEFMSANNMNYTVLADEEPVIEVAEKFGNIVGVLPYTAIVDRSGNIVFVRAGPVTGEEIEVVIQPLL